MGFKKIVDGNANEKGALLEDDVNLLLVPIQLDVENINADVENINDSVDAIIGKDSLAIVGIVPSSTNGFIDFRMSDGRVISRPISGDLQLQFYPGYGFRSFNPAGHIDTGSTIMIHNNGWGDTSRYILSEDGGATWTVYNSPVSLISSYSQFSDKYVIWGGFYSQPSNYTYYSTDLKTWTYSSSQISSSITYDIGDEFFYSFEGGSFVTIKKIAKNLSSSVTIANQDYRPIWHNWQNFTPPFVKDNIAYSFGVNGDLYESSDFINWSLSTNNDIVMPIFNGVNLLRHYKGVLSDGSVVCIHYPQGGSFELPLYVIAISRPKDFTNWEIFYGAGYADYKEFGNKVSMSFATVLSFVRYISGVRYFPEGVKRVWNYTSGNGVWKQVLGGNQSQSNNMLILEKPFD
jgi:hypothetical protein